MRDLGRHGDERVQGLALIDEALQIEALGEGLARGAPSGAQRLGLRARAPQVEEIANRRQQARIVPGLGEVVGGARAHQLHRGLKMRPGGEEDDRQLGRLGAQLAEERHPFRAARGLAVKVHVLDDEVDPLGLQHLKSRCRRAGGQHARAVQAQEHVEGGAHRLAVVDDEDRVPGEARAQGRLRLVSHAAMLHRAWALFVRRCAPHTVRVATEGDTAAARRAGCQAASCPMPQSASTPATR